MIEKIKYKKLYAMIVRVNIEIKRYNFLYNNKDIQQFGYMNHKKNHVIKPHIHKKQTRKLIYTSEVILILKEN